MTFAPSMGWGKHISIETVHVFTHLSTISKALFRILFLFWGEPTQIRRTSHK